MATSTMERKTDMKKTVSTIALVLALLTISLLSPRPVASIVGPDALKYCAQLAFSTEEDFVTTGPEPADGSPIISDGDLLGLIRTPAGVQCAVCARNADLLAQTFDVPVDIGLDAADVLDVDAYLVAFSTELDSPNLGQFTAGDLLITNGVIIPNQALTAKWQVSYDLGLDAVQFIGNLDSILTFLDAARQYPRSAWLANLGLLGSLLARHGIDIWFSTEGTLGPVDQPTFLDGDLLSALTGVIVAGNDVLLPPGVPAGIPVRGVDFGLDAVTTERRPTKERIYFSTSILHKGEVSFSDGDVLRFNNGVIATNTDLVGCFKPRAKELGLDALSAAFAPPEGCISRIDRVGGINVTDISLVDGRVVPGLLGINAPMPFGGRIDLQGNICDDVDQFRVVYRKAGSSDVWEPMRVPAAKSWQVEVDGIMPPCDDVQNWFSDGDGWFDGSDYRQLRVPTGCNAYLPLSIWESTTAVSGADELYEVVLETQVGATIISDTMRLVQLDNTSPVVELNKQAGVCNAYTSADMPIMASGRISDTHFYRYQLTIGGDGYAPHTYPSVAFYDDAGDNVIDTGTINWDTYQDLHEVSVFDLASAPVACGYAVSITAWDRTRYCWFSYPANVPSRCNGCRHSSDLWGFAYTP